MKEEKLYQKFRNEFLYKNSLGNYCILKTKSPDEIWNLISEAYTLGQKSGRTRGREMEVNRLLRRIKELDILPATTKTMMKQIIKQLK